MNVLLIQPFPFKSKIADRYTERLPLGIMYIGEILRKSLNIQIYLLDLSLKLSSFNLPKYLHEKSPDIIGISIHSTSIASLSYQLSDLIKKLIPKSFLIAGGAHVSAVPYEVLQNSSFDIAVCGEGEDIILNLLTALIKSHDFRKVSGIIYRDNGNIIDTGVGPLPDIDKLPNMPTSLINIDDYQLKVPSMPNGKTLNLITSRGCPFQCAFCAYKSISGSKTRFRSPQVVFNELKSAFDNYGFNNFYFVDDNFLLDSNRIVELARLMKSHGLNIHWMCQARADTFVTNPVLTKTIFEMGCVHVSFGIESGDQNVLDKMNKKLQIDVAEKAIRLAKEREIITRCFLMVGLPFQDKSSIQKTIGFLDRTQPDEIAVSMFVPYPGSIIYNEMDSWGVRFVDTKTSKYLYRLDWFDHESISDVKPVIETNWLTTEEILSSKYLIEEAFTSMKNNNNSSSFHNQLGSNIIENSLL